MNVSEYLTAEDNGGDKIFKAKEDFQTSGINLAVVEFTSKRKRASVVVKHTVQGKEMVRVYTKGAPDMLFPMLSGVLDSDMKLHGLEE
jgi:magnesium-transporting ATPase (P-type)